MDDQERKELHRERRRLANFFFQHFRQRNHGDKSKYNRKSERRNNNVKDF